MGSKRILKQCSDTLGLCIERADSRNVLVEGTLTPKVKVHQMLDRVHGVYHEDEYYKWKGMTVYEGKRGTDREVAENTQGEDCVDSHELRKSA